MMKTTQRFSGKHPNKSQIPQHHNVRDNIIPNSSAVTCMISGFEFHKKTIPSKNGLIPLFSEESLHNEAYMPSTRIWLRAFEATPANFIFAEDWSTVDYNEWNF